MGNVASISGKRNSLNDLKNISGLQGGKFVLDEQSFDLPKEIHFEISMYLQIEEIYQTFNLLSKFHFSLSEENFFCVYHLERLLRRNKTRKKDGRQVNKLYVEKKIKKYANCPKNVLILYYTRYRLMIHLQPPKNEKQFRKGLMRTVLQNDLKFEEIYMDQFFKGGSSLSKKGFTLKLAEKFFEVSCKDEKKKNPFSINLYKFKKDAINSGQIQIRENEIVDHNEKMKFAFKHYVEKIKKNCELNTKYLDFIASLGVFCTMGKELYDIKKKEKEKDDLIFNEKKQSMKLLTPHNLKKTINKKFFEKNQNGLSFQEAINEMNILVEENFEKMYYDPNRFAIILSSVCEKIGKIAKRNCINNNEEWVFSADDFFPILFFVLWNSKLKYPNALASYIECFKSHTLNHESLYFLTCFHGVNVFCRNMKEEDLINQETL